MQRPLCFNSDRDFGQWLYFAATAREECTPCSDCTPEYKQKMTEQNRCLQNYVMEKHQVRPVRYIKRDYERKEDHDKLF